MPALSSGSVPARVSQVVIRALLSYDGDARSARQRILGTAMLPESHCTDLAVAQCPELCNTGVHHEASREEIVAAAASALEAVVNLTVVAVRHLTCVPSGGRLHSDGGGNRRAGAVMAMVHC